MIRKLADGTAVATHAGFACPEDRQINLYSKGQLIRSMKWQTCSNAVNVYDSDGSHWVIVLDGGLSFDNEGFACLSEDLVNTLDALIRQH